MAILMLPRFAISAGSSIAMAETVVAQMSAPPTNILTIKTPPIQITAERKALVRASRGATRTSDACPDSTIAPWSI